MFEGIWNKGVKHGEGTYTFPNGNKQKVEWINGETMNKID